MRSNGMYVWMYVCMYGWMYVCMSVCMYGGGGISWRLPWGVGGRWIGSYIHVCVVGVCMYARMQGNTVSYNIVSCHVM
jgi:hypothetical protein